ncbi:hypothetical protein SAMN05216464_110118 [Mucilaginibacter pineti]|uniref:Uncharacterized protein n=1 Tax=Mucilaginibacter pineti TaxID=1391627 RepID=A0A1G7GFN6_9SPHI|nr:hypothetical protein [Mucilaginibacter pineti]SDE86819.1 hypothetical protein SAMN05216464_110118 [Mucilaginibacter pineti]
MALPDNVQGSITAFFSALSAISTYTDVSSGGNKYELYVYSLVHKALSKNFELFPEGLSSAGEFKFKCSPTPISENFSYFTFIVPGRNLYELRNGIEVKGHAMEHEMDIAVFNRANFNHGEYPNHSDLALSLECKFYDSASALKGEVRKYLGAISDLSKFAEPIGLPHLAGCMHLKHEFFKAFVTNVARSSRTDLQDFLSSYSLNPKFGISPGTTEEQSFKDEISSESLNW